MANKEWLLIISVILVTERHRYIMNKQRIIERGPMTKTAIETRDERLGIPKGETLVNLDQKLTSARCRLMASEPFYGHIALGMDWKPNEMHWHEKEARTMGVWIKSNGSIECIWYPGFVAKCSLEELICVVKHELEHIVRLHCIRRDSRDPKIWNIAADMCVNGKRSRPQISCQSDSKVILPLDGNCIWLPEEWDHNGAEHLYHDMETNNKCPNCGKPHRKKGNGQQGQEGQGQGDDEDQDGQGQGDDGNQEGGNGGHSHSKDGEHCDCGGCGQMVGDHTVWQSTEVSQEEARQIVKGIVENAVEKSQGKVPGHLQGAVDNLKDPVVPWSYLLRNFLGRHCGNKRSTYSRANRRFDAFGVKGYSKRAAGEGVVIIDTSGSISQEELGAFFGEIEAISAKSRIHLLQWDAEFQGYSLYRRRDWKKIKINGRGGTDMAGPVEWICENIPMPDFVVMLTDGWCNWATEKPFPMITVITEEGREGPGWGKTVYLQ